MGVIKKALQAGAAVAVVALFPATVHAQAYLQWDHAARALGMGGAAVALADDPTAAFYSPAAIVWLPSTQLQIGGVVGSRGASFDAFGAADSDADAGVDAFPSLFVTHAIAANWSGGFSVTQPWRARVAWNSPADFVGRFHATESELSGFVLNPVVAWRPAGPLSVAVGLALVESSFRVERFEQDPRISALGGGGPIELARSIYDLEATSIGWNAAVHWRPTDELSAGVQFRSQVDADMSGSVDFTLVASDQVRGLRLPSGERVGAFLDRTYVAQDARSQLVFPAIVVGGAAWSPIPPLRLVADLQWIGWSDVDAIAIALTDTTLGSATPLGYDDSWALRLGAEAHPNEMFRVRVGFARAGSPAAFGAVNPILPDAARSSLSLGAGTRWHEIDLDVGYRLSVLEDREGVAFPANDSVADGIYESVEHAFGIAATRRF